MWQGEVPANLETGKETGVHLKHGDIISVVAKGYVRFGPNDTQWSDPESPIPPYKEGFDKKTTALVAMIGDNKTRTYQIGNGKLHWHVPDEGVLSFKFVDAPGKYGDNSGSFQVEVWRETAGSEHKPVTCTLEATNEQGVQSGVTVRNGDKISITVTGSGQWNPNYPASGPEGDGQHKAPSGYKYPLPGANCGAVLMRIGTGDYHAVGSGWSGAVKENGEIAFFYNDDRENNYFADNTGSFQITLTKE